MKTEKAGKAYAGLYMGRLWWASTREKVITKMLRWRFAQLEEERLKEQTNKV